MSISVNRSIDINDIRKIGGRLRKEVPPRLWELRVRTPLGKGAGGDVTHPVDKRVEDIVIEELEGLNKPVTLISEECGVRDINGGGVKLLMDPVDGSRNAVSGITLFSTSIALIDGDTVGDTAIGYILNLISGDEYWTVRGTGSFLNDMRISTQQDTVYKVVAYEARVPRTDIPRIQPLLSLFNRARCLGSTALDMAFLAQGALSTFVVPSPSRSFDFASGFLLVREAGGVVTDLEGHDINYVEAGVERSTALLASGHRELHKQALEVLKG